MGDTIWTNGNLDRDFNNAANFSGTVPEGTGTLYFLRDNTGAGTGPNANMAAHAAVDQDAIFIGPGFTEDIGGSSNDCDISADRVYHGGEGKLWLKDGGGTTDWVVVASSAQSPTKSILNFTGATATKFDVLRGGATIDAGGTVTNIIVGKVDSPQTDANLTIEAGATISTLLEQYAGTTGSNAAIPTLRMMGGNFTQATATISATLFMFGGRFTFNFAGTIPTVYHFDGVIDTMQSGALKTFTNYYWYPGAREQLISTPETLAITNEFPAALGSWA